MRQKTSKDVFEAVFCCPSTAGCAAFPEDSFVSPVRLHRKKMKISFTSGYKLRVASRLGMEASVLFSLCSGTPPGATPPGADPCKPWCTLPQPL